VRCILWGSFASSLTSWLFICASCTTHPRSSADLSSSEMQEVRRDRDKTLVMPGPEPVDRAAGEKSKELQRLFPKLLPNRGNAKHKVRALLHSLVKICRRSPVNASRVSSPGLRSLPSSACC
jgi:hypothetical protein